jgi:hypothetical protein
MGATDSSSYINWGFINKRVHPMRSPFIRHLLARHFGVAPVQVAWTGSHEKVANRWQIELRREAVSRLAYLMNASCHLLFTTTMRAFPFMTDEIRSFLTCWTDTSHKFAPQADLLQKPVLLTMTTSLKVFASFSMGSTFDSSIRSTFIQLLIDDVSVILNESG